MYRQFYIVHVLCAMLTECAAVDPFDSEYDEVKCYPLPRCSIHDTHYNLVLNLIRDNII